MKKIEHTIINDVECKLCSHCQAWKSLNNYSKQNTKWDGLRGTCKNCLNKNIVYDEVVNGELKKKCGRCGELKSLECFGNNAKHKHGKNNYCKLCNTSYRNNNVNIQHSKKVWVRQNKNKINEKRRERYKTDINFRIRMRLRSRLNEVVSRNYRSKTMLSLLGCSVEFLKTYLESKFVEGMTWENHGIGNDKWHIDHVIPCASFDMTNTEHQKLCFHYTNLQPLWQFDNLSKGDSLVNENL